MIDSLPFSSLPTDTARVESVPWCAISAFVKKKYADPAKSNTTPYNATVAVAIGYASVIQHRPNAVAFADKWH
jgi:hypothetical protein